jgi:anaerobic selenocysteine-containing dehydrogenase
MSKQVEAMAPVVQKAVICASCDIACSLIAHVRDRRVTRVRASNKAGQRKNICIKGVYAPRSFAHPDRVRFPLKRVGERGSRKWQQVSWDEAMDDIASRLAAVVERYGPEALAVATSQWNTSVDNGSGRRFMNLLGSPNWISGVARRGRQAPWRRRPPCGSGSWQCVR